MPTVSQWFPAQDPEQKYVYRLKSIQPSFITENFSFQSLADGLLSRNKYKK